MNRFQPSCEECEVIVWNVFSGSHTDWKAGLNRVQLFPAKLLPQSFGCTLLVYIKEQNFCLYVLKENWLYFCKNAFFHCLSNCLNNNCCSFKICKFCNSLYCLEFFAFKSNWNRKSKFIHLRCLFVFNNTLKKHCSFRVRVYGKIVSCSHHISYRINITRNTCICIFVYFK